MPTRYREDLAYIHHVGFGDLALGAALHVASVYDFDLPACRAVTAIGEVLCYVMPGTRAAPPAADLFQRIHEALEPGGLLLFDVIVAEPGGDPMAGQSWRVGDDWAVLAAVSEDGARHLLTREIIAFRRRGDGYRRSYESHVQYIWSVDEVAAMLQEVGFAVEIANAYGSYPLAPRRRAFIARKLSV